MQTEAIRTLESVSMPNMGDEKVRSLEKARNQVTAGNEKKLITPENARKSEKVRKSPTPEKKNAESVETGSADEGKKSKTPENARKAEKVCKPKKIEKSKKAGKSEKGSKSEMVKKSEKAEKARTPEAVRDSTTPGKVRSLRGTRKSESVKTPTTPEKGQTTTNPEKAKSKKGRAPSKSPVKKTRYPVNPNTPEFTFDMETLQVSHDDEGNCYLLSASSSELDISYPGSQASSVCNSNESIHQHLQVGNQIQDGFIAFSCIQLYTYKTLFTYRHTQ